MCKVFGFTNMSLIKNPATVTNVIASYVTATEKDGFGYAILGEKGVYGEKYVGSTDFKSRYTLGPDKDMAWVNKDRSHFGTKGKIVGPAIFHGRTSTNSKGLSNCHPMQRSNWHLIHNGVVTDHGPKYDKVTNNDSEDVLARLMKGGIHEVAAQLTGYYAFLAIDDKGQLHVAKDQIAGLYCAWVDKMDSFVFGTTANLITNIMEELELKHGPIYQVKSDSYMVFQGNEPVVYESFESRGYGQRESKWASKSLGYELPGKTEVKALKSGSEYFGLVDKPFDLVDLEALNELVNYNYDILDPKGEYLDPYEFKRMSPAKQSECTVYSPEGILLMCPDMWQETKFGGYNG